MTIQTRNAQRQLRGQNDTAGRERVSRVLDYVRKNGRLTPHQVAEALNIEVRLAGYTLCNLVRRRELQQAGMVGRRMTYVVYVTPIATNEQKPYIGQVGEKYSPTFTPATGREFWTARDLAMLAR